MKHRNLNLINKIEKVLITIFLGLFFFNISMYADDICYDDMQTSGFCMGVGPCAGGIDCQKIYPLRINSSLQNVKIYYYESGLSGSFGSSCGVDPSGTCQTVHTVDMGPFGFLDQATEFDLGDVNQSTNNPDIWVKNLFGMSCFYGDQLYVTYTKNGVTYKKKLKKCSETENGSNKFREFTPPRVVKNIHGNIKFIGNTVLEYNGTDADDKTNAELDLTYVDVDNNSSTFDSSKAMLNMPPGSTVVWAGLYTQGYLNGITTVDGVYNELNDPNHPLLLTIPSLGTISVIPEVIDYAVNEVNNNIYGYTYDTFSEIKQLEGKKASEVNGWITAANIKCYEGTDESGLGNFGAWTLVVIYKNPNEKFKNITVFDGYKKVAYENGFESVDINVSGFLTPLYGNINSTLSLFVGEGDKYITGDKLYFNGHGINTTNAFDSSITGVIRDPSIQNNQGIDIQNHDVSKYMYNGETNATIRLTSTQDTYFPSVIAFTTDLYVPKVCYYDFNLYDENGNPITSNSKLYTGDKIKVSFKIKNDENETAKNVQFIYPFDENNLTEYISNSTEVKNVLEINFTHIDDNSSIGDLGVYVDNNALKIGILGDNDKNFLPYETNNSYVAGIEFNTTLEHEGNLSFVFYTDYNYSIGDQNFTYNDILPKCSDFENNYNVYHPVVGSFNVVHYQPNITNDPIDRNNSINALYTQIVNKEFNVTVVKLKDDNQTVETDFNGIIEVDLINNPKNDNEFKNNPTLWKHYVIFNNNIPELNITYNKADKNLTFRIKYLVDNYGKILEFNNANCINNTNSCIFGMLESRVYPSGVCTPNNHSDPSCICYDECQGSGSSNLGCVDCVFGSSLVRTVSARDSFAIRPYKFAITSVNNKKTAGKEFNITIKALDYNGNPALDYNETLYLNENPPSNSPYLDYNDTNASKGCIRGNLIGTNLVFKNGEANVTLDYSEVGDLNVTIKEINGSEFAKVDEKDTSDKNRIIKQNSTVITFIPSHFKIEGIFKNFNDSNFTYISNDLNMSSILDLNITAQNDKNSTTKNYNSVCYAKNFDLNVSYQISAEINNTIKKILIKEEKETNETNISLPNLIIKNFSKNYFTTDNNGTARLILYINFDKNYSNTVNEFNFTVNDINISDEDNVTGTKYLDKNATFRYGRIDVQNVSGYGNEVNATFSYEYWTDDEGWVVNKEHNSSVFGDVNETNSYHQFVNMNVNHNILNGEENVTLSTSHALPYSTKIHLSVPSWLWYHPLAKDYKDPKTTSGWNLDCLTHPCFNVNFQKQSSGWGGVGTNEVNYSEQNRTVEINASTSKIKANKSEVKKLNW